MKRTPIVLAVAIAIVALVAILFLYPKTPSTRLRIGYIPIADSAQVLLAQDSQYFADEGLQVDLVPMDGGSKILEALGSGSLDIGFSNVVSLILAHDQKLDFVSIAGGPVEDKDHAEHAILVGATSSIANVSDLASRRVAVNTRKNIDELFLRALLRKRGVDPESVILTEVPFPRMLDALSGASIDAAAAIEPFVSAGLGTNNFRALTYNYVELRPTTQVSTYVSQRSWAVANPDAVLKFQRAIARATSLAESDKLAVRRMLPKYTKLLPGQLEQMVLPTYIPTANPEMLDSIIALTRAEGWISRSMTAADLILASQN